MAEPRYYILANRRPVRVRDRFVWAKWSRENLKERLVAHHQVRNVVIRTIFTGVDLDEREEHYDRRQRPKVYESYAWLIGASEAMEVHYYRSHAEAVSGHLQLLKKYQRLPSRAEAIYA